MEIKGYTEKKKTEKKKRPNLILESEACSHRELPLLRDEANAFESVGNTGAWCMAKKNQSRESLWQPVRVGSSTFAASSRREAMLCGH